MRCACPSLALGGVAERVKLFVGQLPGATDEPILRELFEPFGSVADVVDLWLDHNGIPAASQTTATLNGGDVVHDAYSGGNEGTCLSLYTVEQEFGAPGDHVWFSQDMDGVSPSRILWDFFNEGCSAVSSVSDLDAGAVQLHPNPFEDHVVLEGLGGAVWPYSIMTLSGQLVRSGMVESPGTIHGLDELPAGVYVLQTGAHRFRIVK